MLTPMKRIAALLALALPLFSASPAQIATAEQSPFTYEALMVPMRDGARLQTIVLRPRGRSDKLPILLVRTPYGVPASAPRQAPGYLRAMMDDGYIVVLQSMRGRFGSDGTFAASMAMDDPINEATDAYDTIDWLVKTLPGNSGKVGMLGISYPGLTAALSLMKPHPALKAVSPQAAWADWWMNDDLHRNGAIRLSYATDWLWGLQADKSSNADFPYGDAWDLYDWFLAQGNADAIETRYMKGRVPAFRALIDHPDYDAHWKRERWIDRLGRTTVPTLNVAGFWDQEDPWGSWAIYRKAETNDPDHLNLMVAGPWNHGSWSGKGDMLGPVLKLGADSGTQFQTEIQAPFFRYWLHGKGVKPNWEARMFQSGSNVWKSYAAWPPAGAKPTSLYLHADGSLSFTAPGAVAADSGYREYLSDPAKPVPFRPRPISPTYPCGEWCWWEARDQRFVDGRPDVLTYVSAPLERDLEVSGEVAATIFASTSGTDSDFVVKLIDVYPNNAEAKPWGDGPAPLNAYGNTANGYQLPIAMEVRRGRWLASNETARPLTPNTPTAWQFALRDRNHVFLKGHRIMVQIQSSWFPMIDRNPQSFVPNIAKAPPGAYRSATQRVYSTSAMPSRIILPAMP
jgi:putative CocE/NonD family hydrolase